MLLSLQLVLNYVTWWQVQLVKASFKLDRHKLTVQAAFDSNWEACLDSKMIYLLIFY